MERPDVQNATSDAPRNRGERTLRNPERTQERILVAARDEFSQKGLGGARVNAIAEAAGVNKQLLYYYFEDKETLYTAVLEQVYRDIRERGGTLDLDALSPDVAMAAFIRSNFDFLVENRHFVALVNDANIHKARHIKASEQIPALHSALRENLEKTLERGLAEGCFARWVDPMELYISIASLTYFSFSNTFTLSTIFGTDVSSVERMAERRERIVDIILCFLSTPAKDAPPGSEGSASASPSG